MKNIDTAFRHIRLFNLVFLMACFTLCCYTVYKTQSTLAAGRGKVYVLINGKLLQALSMDRNIPVEIRDHVTTFHHYFLTLSPDDKAIQQNMAKALYLADGSAKRQYESLKESGYYTNVIVGNISQSVEIDSIQLNMEHTPFYFKCFAKQTITRTTSIVIRNLITEGFIRTGLPQSDNNTHGFLIEKWATLENNDLKTISR